MNERTLRVLVVDDNESVRREIRQVLKSQADMRLSVKPWTGPMPLQRHGSICPMSRFSMSRA